MYMIIVKRSPNNPLLMSNKKNSWEAEATFHGSIIKEDDNKYKLFYRAISLEQLYEGVRLQQSTIGIAESNDGENFFNRRQLITPEHDWEKYGCEDPRVTKFEGKYYIFYTAISNWPPNADGIRVGVAITENFDTIIEKHLVTPFNAKAMTMFPERINGKIAVILTVNTDRPPSRICVAYLDEIHQLWDESFWNQWYKTHQEHEITITQTDKDHMEVGSQPVRTDEGWILVFCYIENYFNEHRIFRIDALLLDLHNPRELIGQTLDPLLVPEEPYELYGMVPNVIFPSGALAEGDRFYLYYSGTDTTVCRASVNIHDLLFELKSNPAVNPERKHPELLTRFEGNPIISPIEDHPWESKYTFNVGALYAGDKFHIVYRAMGDDDTSVFGYAVSTDGLHIDERLPEPIYVPREHFEQKYHPGFSGCEDPRLTRIGDTIYMNYTAYDGNNPPRIALATITVDDFLNRRWNWSKPKLISAPGIDDKDSCIVSEKVNDSYVVFHRLPPCIWIDMVSDLEFGDNKWLGGHPLMGPRVNAWDDLKIGLNGPPEKTEDGWLLLYHGVSKRDAKYRMGAALLDLNNPFKVLARLQNPIFEPLAWYENEGYRHGTVFSNGQVIKDGILYIYYGGADKYTGVCTAPVKTILDALKKGM